MVYGIALTTLYAKKRAGVEKPFDFPIEQFLRCSHPLIFVAPHCHMFYQAISMLSGGLEGLSV